MESTKKRKRDVELPRIVYDATTRIFDRLFKEDSLEGMKDVVRKKLRISASTPLKLAQLRDGQAVDLEDDDDFEAFTSSAYKSSTAKVKVFIGDGASSSHINGIHQDQTQPNNSSEKAKKKNEKGRDQSEAVASLPTSSNSQPPPAKKRRVSFAETSKQLAKDSERAETTKGLGSVASGLESSPELEPTLPERPLDASSSSKRKENSVEAGSKDGRKKRKKKRKDSVSPGEAAETPELQPPAPTDKPAKKTPQKSHDEDDATGKDAPKETKSKKMSRKSEANSADIPESEKVPTPATVEATSETANTEETVRAAKKRKRTDGAHTDSANEPPIPTNPSNIAANPKTPKKSRIKSKLIIEAEEHETIVTAPVEEASKPAKRPRRKSNAQPPAPVTSAEKESSSQNTPAVTPTTEASTKQGKAAAKPVSKRGSDGPSTQIEVKTPKKTKADGSSVPVEDPREMTNAAEITRRAVQAVLARRGISVTAAPATPTDKDVAPSSSSTKTTPAIAPALETPKKSHPSSAAKAPPALDISDPSLLQMSSSDESVATVVASSSVKVPPSVPSGAPQNAPVQGPLSSAQILDNAKKAPVNETKKKADPPSTCPVCDEPYHVRTKCPIIKSGIRAMRRRIGELRLTLADEGVSNPNDQEQISATIEELQVLIEKKTRKPRTSELKQPAAAAAPAVKSVDASHPSSEVNVVASPAVQLPLLDAQPQLISTRAAPSADPPPSTPVSSTQPKTSAKHIPPSAQSSYSSQPLSATTQRTRPSQLPPASQPPPKKPRQSMPASTSSAFDLMTPPSFQNLRMAPDGVLGYAGNMSSVSDRDLEELMRGPKISLQDVPSDDDDASESDDNEQEPDVVLEEDENDKPVSKKLHRVEYTSSSDEDEEEEEESPGVEGVVSGHALEAAEIVQVQEMTGASSTSPTPGNEKDKEDSTELAVVEAEIPEKLAEEEPEVENVDEQEEQSGDKSFHEMDLSSSSRSSWHAGDIAANDAVAADLELIDCTPSAVPAPSSPSSQGSVQPVARGTDNQFIAPESTTSPAPATPIAHSPAPDPIENVDEPEPEVSQPDAILSADDAEEPAPAESTPKEKIVLRKSRRNSAAPQLPATLPPRLTRSKDTAAVVAVAGPSASQPEPPTTGRKTRSKQLMKISELPVPDPPFTGRVTRATQSQAQAPTPTPVPVTPRPLRARVIVAAPTTPAAKIPTTRASKAAKPTPKAKLVIGKLASKASGALKTRASRLAADLVSSDEEEQEHEPAKAKPKDNVPVTPANPDASVAEWAVLHESQSGPSQIGSEHLHGTADVDELMSSPSVTNTIGGKRNSEPNTPQQEPLFVAADSQQSLPYSQWPLPQTSSPTLPTRSRSASPNDSDDDDDANMVASSLIRSRPSTSSSQYRSMTEIVKAGHRYAPRYSSQLATASPPHDPLDPFGRGRKNDEDESEDSESESEAESTVGRFQAAHFPSTRAAGAVNTPPRRK